MRQAENGTSWTANSIALAGNGIYLQDSRRGYGAAKMGLAAISSNTAGVERQEPGIFGSVNWGLENRFIANRVGLTGNIGIYGGLSGKRLGVKPGMSTEMYASGGVAVGGRRTSVSAEAGTDLSRVEHQAYEHNGETQRALIDRSATGLIISARHDGIVDGGRFSFNAKVLSGVMDGYAYGPYNPPSDASSRYFGTELSGSLTTAVGKKLITLGGKVQPTATGKHDYRVGVTVQRREF